MPLFRSNFDADAFWLNLFEDTENLSKAALYPKLLDLNHDWESMFKDWFCIYSCNESLRQQATIRVYVDGSGESRPIDRISSHPPTETESLSEWGERLFDQNEWCIVMDRMSGCMEELAVAVAKATEPAMATFPPGEFSHDISPYIGRYHYTPFGAHLDVGDLSVLHLHLGPGCKEMTLWPKERFQELTGSTARTHEDFEHLLSKGVTYNIRPGDVFHLPACTHYHVATNIEYSVGITLGLKKENPVSLFRKAIRDFQEESPNEDTRDAVNLYGYKKQSNGGFLMKPMLADYSAGDVEGGLFVRKNPFKIVIRPEGEAGHSVFARGRKLPEMIHEPSSLVLIEKLNAGETVPAQKDEGSAEQLILIKDLYNHHGITRVSD